MNKNIKNMCHIVKESVKTTYSFTKFYLFLVIFLAIITTIVIILIALYL